MSLGARTAWGAAAVASLFLAMAISWRIPAQRDVDAGATEAPGLLVEFSRRPAFILGFRNAAADVVWLQAVQVSGNRKMRRADYDRLAILLDAVANYDPRFIIPYLLGGLVLGESLDHAGEAIKVLARGQAQYPADWRFPFYIGFTQYFCAGDAAEGGRSMASAARIPGSPEYLGPLAARMLSEAREPAAALAFLAEMERHEPDDARREILRRRIRDVVVERDIQALESAVAAFRARNGTLPAGLGELVAAGFVERLPREPNGGAYVLRPDGKVASDRVSARLRVFRKR